MAAQAVPSAGPGTPSLEDSGADERRGGEGKFFLRRRLEAIPELFKNGKVWESKEESKAPKGDWYYLEREAARFSLYNPEQWVLASATSRARAIAHYLEHNMRQAYTSEQLRPAPEKEKAGVRKWEDEAGSFYQYRQGGGEA